VFAGPRAAICKLVPRNFVRGANSLPTSEIPNAPAVKRLFRGAPQWRSSARTKAADRPYRLKFRGVALLRVPASPRSYRLLHAKCDCFSLPPFRRSTIQASPRPPFEPIFLWGLSVHFNPCHRFELFWRTKRCPYVLFKDKSNLCIVRRKKKIGLAFWAGVDAPGLCVSCTFLSTRPRVPPNGFETFRRRQTITKQVPWPWAQDVSPES